MSLICRIFCCFPTHLKKATASQPGDARPFESAPRSSDIHGEHGSYWPTCPLPRYTERPISIYEKTIVFNRGSNPQGPDLNGFPRDEKRQQNANDSGAQSQTGQREPEVPVQNTGGDHASDVSSTFSFPSSYGNTSTATRSPPPAYSPPTSCAASQRTPSISLASVEADATQGAFRTDTPPSLQSQPQHPRPVLRHDHLSDQWITRNTERRRSWGSNRSTLPITPTYSRD